MLTDSFLDKQAGQFPVDILCEVLGKLCIPLAGARVKELRAELSDDSELDATMAEVELCVSLIFKPLRHHMKVVIKEDPSVFLALWKPILNVTKEILDDASGSKKLTDDTRELTMEHLKNVIMVLSSFGVLNDGSIGDETWSLIEQMAYCKKFVAEWKESAAQPPTEE